MCSGCQGYPSSASIMCVRVRVCVRRYLGPPLAEQVPADVDLYALADAVGDDDDFRLGAIDDNAVDDDVIQGPLYEAVFGDAADDEPM